MIFGFTLVCFLVSLRGFFVLESKQPKNLMDFFFIKEYHFTCIVFLSCLELKNYFVPYFLRFSFQHISKKHKKKGEMILVDEKPIFPWFFFGFLDSKTKKTKTVSRKPTNQKLR